MLTNENGPPALTTGDPKQNLLDDGHSVQQTDMPRKSNLSDAHLAHLRDTSGLTDEVIEARGYRTIEKREELRSLGFSATQSKLAPGLLIPVWTTDGGNGLYVFRPDSPHVEHNKKTGKSKVRKYENMAGQGIRLDCPPGSLPHIGNPHVPLWITEGQKKVDALVSHGACAIALLGVHGFKGRNDLGGNAWLADWSHIALKGKDDQGQDLRREVRIVFDSDVMINPNVKKALEELKGILEHKGALVRLVFLRDDKNKKVGVDDYLLEHSFDELEALVDAPPPQATPAAPLMEALDAAPLAMTRPLALIDGRSHLATWIHVKLTYHESLNKDGQIIRHDPPIVVTEQRKFILRADGEVFSELHAQGVLPAADLGFETRLPEIPPADKRLTSRGLNRYRAGERPDPADVFNRVVSVIDRFVDFDRSLASQREMSELLALYILATWFLDAFNVIGFVWPNGERGSGKTKVLMLIGELGYLGQVILAGGSFATLRDLADYGATLCFDDAENLADATKTDPDKRTLLLAGNRKGNYVTFKEQAPDRTWRTRYVSTYCPRAFSAIRMPDPVLASRTILIPLVRSADKRKANADVLEYDLWPADRQRLIDDLWLLALANLPKLTAIEREVSNDSDLTGRNLEPWRAMLAMAKWLTAEGVSDLYERMATLAAGYQGERAEFEANDLARLIVKALARLAGCDTSDTCDTCDTSWGDTFTFKTAQLQAEVRKLVDEEELGLDENRTSADRIGKKIKSLRFGFNPKREPGTGKRMWECTKGDILRLVKAYHGESVTPTRKVSQASQVSQVSHPEGDQFTSFADHCRECGEPITGGECLLCKQALPF